MKQLVILSGKGGTGKTTVAAALADLAAQTYKLVLADADVDAANLELVLAPTDTVTHPFESGELAIIQAASCTGCGRCAEVCRFDAIAANGDGATYRVDPLACEGCAACFYACPAGAITMQKRQAGRWFSSNTRFGPLYHAHLFAGEENSGMLVTLIKQTSRLRARDDGADLLLVDGPPGIGCPVIATLAGADLALVVTEPTVAGISDLKRMLGTAAHFGVQTAVMVNKADLNPEQTAAVRHYCAEHEIPWVGELPYDPAVVNAMVRGIPVTAAGGPVAQALRAGWQQLQALLAA